MEEVNTVNMWITPSLMILLLIQPLRFIFAAETMECTWHTAYFDASYWDWYGHGSSEEAERYKRDVMMRSYLVIRLDSLLRSINGDGKGKSYKKWILIDNQHASYQQFGSPQPGDIHIEDQKVYFCFTDSLAVNNLLNELWGLSGIHIDYYKPCNMWLFSLHAGTYRTLAQAERFPDTLWIFERPDSDLVWLKIDKESWVHHAFCQHEIDGYYHRYLGLYLTKRNAVKAQKLFFENLGQKTTITSQYVTPAILRKYIWN
jgi:hypothetical protein